MCIMIITWKKSDVLVEMVVIIAEEMNGKEGDDMFLE